MAIEPWQRQMVRCLFPYSAKRLSIEQAFMIKHPHIPQKLYKYRDFSNKYHLEGLEQDQQWFSSPDRFNDPFDTIASFTTDAIPRQRQSLEECLAAVESIRQTEAAGGKWIPPEITNPVTSQEWQADIIEPLIEQLPDEQRAPIRELIRSWGHKVNEDLVSRMSAFLQRGFSVLSLSANPVSTLMWAHYAAAHTGFCIEYDFGCLPYGHLRKRMCFPAFYRGKRTSISRYLAQGHQDFNNLVGNYLCLMKSPDWCYEQEWRIVHAIGPSAANQSCDMPQPSALIVGALVSDTDLEYARSFCTRRQIPLRQAQLSSASFDVIIDDA